MTTGEPRRYEGSPHKKDDQPTIKEPPTSRGQKTMDSKTPKTWEATLAALEDSENPTAKDYALIQRYLRSARPYLNPLRRSYPGHETCRRIGQHIKFIPPGHPKPIFKFHKGKRREHCIVMYCDPSRKYMQHALRNFSLLPRFFEGDILLRVGGFPNLPWGGIRSARVPYGFKFEALDEARNRGYRCALWLDVALEPLHNLGDLFNLIERHGSYFYRKNHLGASYRCVDGGRRMVHKGVEIAGSDEAYASMGLTPASAQGINHLSGGIYGINFSKPASQRFMKLGREYIKKVTPYIGGCPDETVFSVLVHKSGIQSHGGANVITTCREEAGKLFLYHTDH